MTASLARGIRIQPPHRADRDIAAFHIGSTARSAALVDTASSPGDVHRVCHHHIAHCPITSGNRHVSSGATRSIGTHVHRGVQHDVPPCDDVQSTPSSAAANVQGCRGLRRRQHIACSGEGNRTSHSKRAVAFCRDGNAGGQSDIPVHVNIDVASVPVRRCPFKSHTRLKLGIPKQRFDT